MKMFEFLINKLKAQPRKIVFTEGTDPRILEASARLLSGTFLTPVLVGNVDEVQKAAEDIGFNIRGAEIVDPAPAPSNPSTVDVSALFYVLAAASAVGAGLLSKKR